MILGTGKKRFPAPIFSCHQPNLNFIMLHLFELLYIHITTNR